MDHLPHFGKGHLTGLQKLPGGHLFIQTYILITKIKKQKKHTHTHIHKTENFYVLILNVLWKIARDETSPYSLLFLYKTCFATQNQNLLLKMYNFGWLICFALNDQLSMCLCLVYIDDFNYFSERWKLLYCGT